MRYEEKTWFGSIRRVKYSTDFRAPEIFPQTISPLFPSRLNCYIETFTFTSKFRVWGIQYISQDRSPEPRYSSSLPILYPRCSSLSSHSSSLLSRPRRQARPSAIGLDGAAGSSSFLPFRPPSYIMPYDLTKPPHSQTFTGAGYICSCDGGILTTLTDCNGAKCIIANGQPRCL